jgi:hypothetical protein
VRLWAGPTDGSEEHHRASVARGCLAMSADARMTWGTGHKGQIMAHVISEILLNGNTRATLMGSKSDDRRPEQVLRIRLVFVEWVDRTQDVPRVVAEYSEHTDALGTPIWQSAEKLPLALVLAALGGQVPLRAQAAQRDAL